MPTRTNVRSKHCRRAVRLRVSYALNVSATVTFTIKRRAAGRMVNGRCVRPTRKNHRRRGCTRLITVRGKLVQRGAAGPNRLTFKARIGGRPLRPGRYRLIATPAGGEPATAGFTLAS